MRTRAAPPCAALPAVHADSADSVALLVDCKRESGKKQARRKKESRGNQSEFPHHKKRVPSPTTFQRVRDDGSVFPRITVPSKRLPGMTRAGQLQRWVVSRGWTILSIIAAVGPILPWRGPNAVWGATTFGLIGGLVTAGVYQSIDSGLRWSTVGKWVVVSVLAGLATERIWRVTRRNST